ncbi:M20 aminoacylase family protein [Roseomonas xinghualingensis]|uniref:M20 aminoacylase family protein n=1 Tax=Roseomonas xinghualingensis TaxID=2986475 RepID=UPI0021F12D7B|nr:M20 aminoacylase family protein [Roseomonas sp. SXEYE001]MCV4208658.1 M20 family metallopeptidase [Roseomonas sp. SXEYE001]
MPNVEALEPLAGIMTEWRRDLHAHPELGFEEQRTAALVARELRAAGIAVEEGIAGTGVVGTLRGSAAGTGGNRAIGLRADMDALAMEEATGTPYASRSPGRMHACGHDGHTAMLLGAAKWLAANRDRFAGTVHLIFQPAEESRGGAQAMLKDGLFERFPVDAVYAIHNLPGLPLGTVAVPKGAVLASSDTWEVTFRGRGTHGAKPHLGTDATLAAAAFITALQSIVSRELDPLATGVVSVGHIAAGNPEAPNVIPAQVLLRGTARALSPEVRDMLEERIGGIARGVAAVHGVEAVPVYTRRLPPTVNHPAQAALMHAAAATTLGTEHARDDHPPITAGEDFACMLEARPGAYAWLGTGDPAHPEGWHHNPHFDFNDAALVAGAAFLCGVVEAELGA